MVRESAPKPRFGLPVGRDPQELSDSLVRRRIQFNNPVVFGPRNELELGRRFQHGVPAVLRAPEWRAIVLSILGRVRGTTDTSWRAVLEQAVDVTDAG